MHSGTQVPTYSAHLIDTYIHTYIHKAPTLAGGLGVRFRSRQRSFLALAAAGWGLISEARADFLFHQAPSRVQANSRCQPAEPKPQVPT